MFKFIGKLYSGLVTGVAGLITTGIEKVTGKTYGRITAEEFREEPVGKALTQQFEIATAILGVVSLPTALPFIAKTIITKPIQSLVIGGLLTTAGGRYLIEKSAEGIYTGGVALGKAVEVAKEKGEELSLGEALETAGLVGAGLILGAGAPAIIEKIKGIELPKLPETKPEALGVAEKPILPVTEVITTTKKKPTQRRRATKTPSVKQSVRINIINAPINRNYLKRQLLIH